VVSGEILCQFDGPEVGQENPQISQIAQRSKIMLNKLAVLFSRFSPSSNRCNLRNLWM